LPAPPPEPPSDHLTLLLYEHPGWRGVTAYNILPLLSRITKKDKGFIWPEKELFKANYKKRYKKCYKEVYTQKKG
jgi:hypothetical protein